MVLRVSEHGRPGQRDGHRVGDEEQCDRFGDEEEEQRPFEERLRRFGYPTGELGIWHGAVEFHLLKSITIKFLQVWSWSHRK